MKNWKNSVILAVVAMGLVSCVVRKEKLTPKYKTMTVNELKNDKPITFSYQIDENQIDEYAQNSKKFPLFGKLFQSIARVLANNSIYKSGGHPLDLPAADVDLSSLSAINFDLIQFVNFDSLVLTVSNAKGSDSLAFITTLEIYGKLDNPVPGLEVNSDGYSKLVYYDVHENTLGCDGKCLKLNIAKIDWKQLLATNKFVHLQPKLIINSVPLSTMKLAGSIDFSVKFDLGF